ncbi:SNF2 family DNA or RNA helicase [Mucilaginibacter frigoritolerans]|uniref:SNF2 family DNA or RNA helicase n=1 Tax=Mucilaginibacter frigoritolerans TaxID=652788 RepID=A0A562U4R1_9SPHI|nr:DEAD/DEAH box helicase [Mucilaginibacter frigoritolerans]TWJ00826.1 SNF2 family DNA or RNA helicase [Mucilaginibacter frigoritolerans]
MSENKTAHHLFVLEGITFQNLTETEISRHTAINFNPDQLDARYVFPSEISINKGSFNNKDVKLTFSDVTLLQEDNRLIVGCECAAAPHKKLCAHQAAVLLAVLKKDDYRVFFDKPLRDIKLRRFAVDYGMEDEAGLDDFFQIENTRNGNTIHARLPSLLAVNKESINALRAVIVPDAEPVINEEQPICIIIREHKYYKYLYIDLYEAQFTKDGNIKNPLKAVAPLDLMWKTNDAEQLKFFAGVHKFQNHLNKTPADADITALKAIVNNPLKYDFYFHDAEVSEKITASSVFPVKVGSITDEPKLAINPKEQFFELSGSISIARRIYELKDLAVRFTYFVWTGDGLYLAANLQQLKVMALLTRKSDNLLVHASKFEELRKQLLSQLEDKVSIDYKHIPAATPKQLEAEGFNKETERIIYLSDFGAHVMIIPVMRYGEVEISIRTKKQIYSADKKGKPFLVARNYTEEDDFTALLVKQHTWFEEQLEDDLYYFYLHKKYFLDEEWFLNVFEEWRTQGITILGFNELEGNKLNPYKVKINIKVLSGINWFNVVVDGRFGRKKAALKQIYRAVKNKTKYVQLDDGTLGILPQQWIEKFTDYFNAGEVAEDDSLQVSKSNFTTIEWLFDNAMLDERVKEEISVYHQKLSGFESVQSITTPKDFNGELRPYQQQGLSWLNFLDDFNFGGCLADDMGLGKTVQVIAFILSQRAKVSHNVNLIVVPTSLIFNWQHEIEKFAPSIRVHTIYGAERIKHTEYFGHYEVVLTSYGTLLADIVFLKNYEFNYIFLDESQQIKNPESQRYKATRLLKSRNKIVLTGTPFENNTFDLYGQLSFACPGLLGSKTYFKQIYSMPIDMFKSSKRATELQQKISPFVLRRTKQDVATDLPEKTEMVLYCEMKPEQRSIYEAYEKEFRDYIAATTGEELKKSPMNVLKGLTRLRQICDSPLLIKGEKMPGHSSAKIDMLMEEIEGKMHRHKILVFSQFVTMLDLIRAELKKKAIRFTYLTGQTRNRQQVIEEFQNDSEVRVFLISLKAGGTGLNLTEADYVYLVDPWWNPAVENQAIDRCHRIGQDKNIVAVRLICPDTIEEKIMVLQETKHSLAKDIVTTDNSFIQSLSKKQLVRLFDKDAEQRVL